MQKTTIKLEGREIIDFPQHPSEVSHNIRHFGVALNHDEAQEYIERGYRVYGDHDGPYLVIRLKADQLWPWFWDLGRVDVEFRPLEWRLDNADRSGIICWLEKAS